MKNRIIKKQPTLVALDGAGDGNRTRKLITNQLLFQSNYKLDDKVFIVDKVT
ncbi:hypothetical protein [Desulfosporosinus hippei]|uniref:hypothetical protein n=1 Tax=Desulfosporosinus hippei TaxID=569859 RepID=UPI001A9A5254|nr:hypothetical protein [Desulfosporosinus hippei]